jgi:hypothetical protein
LATDSDCNAACPRSPSAPPFDLKRQFKLEFNNYLQSALALRGSSSSSNRNLLAFAVDQSVHDSHRATAFLRARRERDHHLVYSFHYSIVNIGITSPPARSSLSAPQSRCRPGRWPTELSLKPMQEQVFFNVLDLLCVHSTRRNDSRTRAGSIRSAIRQGEVQAKAHVRSGAECPSFFLGRLDRNGEALE